ncbi:HAD family hydrolase [Mangrovibacillus cuniculi]|uniref:HAD family hydrolase n=1 Tax=Mangrovibacillus cuniculi TaxID=2593652 RepID=A0A7S8HEJ8_9BACI|nr:HAD family hydrolase [Mangrovibacillus cuniculi]QPC45919.1 HAD family hydrolase [Mangrovibacillus cuniculi]
MIKAIIFDFDGLIIDTETIWYEAFKQVVEQKHKKELTIERFSTCIGTGNNVLEAAIRELVGESLEFDKMEEASFALYKELLLHPVLRDGVLDYLQEAKANGIRIALASSSSRSWIEGYLQQLGILEYFEVINTKNDVKNVKPDPELYLKTLKDCNLSAKEAVVFEDSLNGLRAAKAAGITCVVVPNPVTVHMPFEQHDFKLNSMKDMSLLELLKQLEATRVTK